MPFGALTAVALIVTCTDPAIVAGQPAGGCPAGSLVFKEESAFWEPALTPEDVSDLLAGIFLTLFIAWGFVFIRRTIFNR